MKYGEGTELLQNEDVERDDVVRNVHRSLECATCLLRLISTMSYLNDSAYIVTPYSPPLNL